MQYENGIWIFGYGSLIWNPGFAYASKQQATLSGFARVFCLWSVHYRGNAAQPGLVLGLNPADGESCEGVAYYVGAGAAKEVHEYLRARELVSYAYLERLLPLRLQDGREVQAICYIVDPDHSQYAGGLSLAAQAEVIKRAHGSVGPNLEYLQNTAAHLETLGIVDENMKALLKLTASI